MTNNNFPLISAHEQAERYRSIGWSIFPIQPLSKRPLISWKEFQDRLPDREEVIEWYTRWPDAGIAVALGPVSGIVVVDVDSVAAEQVLIDLLGDRPQTRKAYSGSLQPGKVHYYFRDPEFETAARYTPLHPQLELRGYGGCVVLPPSLHPSGNRYRWENHRTPICELPPALAEVWEANPRIHRNVSRAAEEVGAVTPNLSRATILSILRSGVSEETQSWILGRFAETSGWNNRLFRVACDMNASGFSQQAALPLLLRGARPRTPADHEQALATIASAYSQPRSPSRAYYGS